MNSSQLEGFYAYPSKPEFVAKLIESALTRTRLNVSGWPQADNWGKMIREPIIEKIAHGRFLVADITKLNLNVTYEIGYAIGCRKRVFLTMCASVTNDEALFRKIGLFDTIGFKTYESSDQLLALLHATTDESPLFTAYPQDKTAPVYVVEKPKRSDVINIVTSRIKKSRLKYRSFNPQEQSRLSATEAIEHVARSFGTVIPLASTYEIDSDVHNIRCAFVAGLSHGLNRRTLILQPEDGPSPIDIRDLVSTYRHPDDIPEAVNQLAFDVYNDVTATTPSLPSSSNALAKVSFGDPMAENEFDELSHYYIQTDEYLRAKRGEINLVVGRKGTGKTALFSQLRNRVREESKNNIVVDLKPEGYQLVRLKEKVIKFLSQGTAAHVITAFWEYVLYMEIAYKVLEKDAQRHMVEHDLYESYIALQKAYYRDSPMATLGDFSERLNTLSELIAASFEKAHGKPLTQIELTTPQVTELIHRDILHELREALKNHLKHKNEVWVLFDNLDKGWNATGPSQEDIIILTCLLDASRKIMRDLRKHLEKAIVVVFLRNDVYQFLVRNQSDFGKESRGQLDWNDVEQLRTIVKRRLSYSLGDKKAALESMLSPLLVPMHRGMNALDYLIEMSLMRPRYLIRLLTLSKGVAINRDHKSIESDDLDHAIKIFSDDLLNDLSNEIRDIYPLADDILLGFLAEKKSYQHDEILAKISSLGPTPESARDILRILIYFGACGVRQESGEVEYIYQMAYNIKKFEAYIDKFPRAEICFHPALHHALGLK